MPVPVGLLGLAIRTARVSGVIASSTACSGKLHARLRVIDLADLGAGHLGIEAVHGVGRPQEHDLLAVVDVGVDEDLDGFVGAVGEDELLGRDAEVIARSPASPRRTRGRRRARPASRPSLQRGDHVRGAADRVLVEVEAQLAGAAAGGRRIGRHREHGRARFDGAFRES